MLLNVQSVYTLLASTVKIKEYVSLAKDLGYDAIGIADKNVLYGVYEFHQICLQNHLQPLIGMKVEMPGLIIKDRQFSFLLYAKNLQGYYQLIHISRLLMQDKDNSQAIWSYLKETPLDLVLITLGKQTELDYLVIHGQEDQAQRLLQEWQSIFLDNIYLGISAIPHNMVEIDSITKFGQKHLLTPVMSQKVETLYAHEAKGLEVLKAIDQKEQLDRASLQFIGSNYLYSRDQLYEAYTHIGLSDLIYNTESLCSQLQLVLPSHKNLLPKFHNSLGISSEAYLREITYQELQNKGLTSNAYQSQLAHELDVIETMGFSDYFLIVADIINFCSHHQIRTGPGRGSAAGSLVSYLLGITKVDPLAYHLLFERFLNPERRNMPDIDIDIPDDKRHLVIDYVKEKYGQENVAQIATFGTLKAKQVIRDTLKVLGFDNDTLKDWSDRIPSDQNNPMTLDRAYQENKYFRKLVDANSDHQQIFELAKSIEGIPRQVSTHAAAVVLNDFPLEQVLPVFDKVDQGLTTQYTMYDVESIGLLKMDFLGLRNLTILDDILHQIAKDTGELIDIYAIDMEDPQTLQIFQNADTNGVFQFESPGIKRVLRNLKPERFEDIIAVNALFRPGPMKQISTFIRRKNGEEPITYLLPVLEPILENTYGIIVYQEQVMEIVVRMAGYSLGEADILRRAMGKKDSQLMQQEANHFVSGALKQGYSQDQAQQIFNYIYQFANYGFNRSHAVVYSMLAYQLAYLKAHYPIEFYSTILNSGSSQSSTFQSYIQEAKLRLGRFASLDINRSLRNFSKDGSELRVGFDSIKGMRRDFAEEIIDNRNQFGPFQDFLEFLRRLPQRMLKADYIRPLIFAGAFDALGYNRASLDKNLETLIQSVNFSGNSIALFKEMEPKIENFVEYPEADLRSYEKEYLGFTLEDHPLSKFMDQFKLRKDLIELHDFSSSGVKKNIRTIALVKQSRVIKTKKGELMAFVTLTNEIIDLPMVVFPNLYRQVKVLLVEDSVIEIIGNLESSKEGEDQIIANTIQAAQVSELNDTDIPTCFIKINDFISANDKINLLKKLALENPGPSLIIIVDSQRHPIQLDPPYLISYSDRVKNQVKAIFGKEAVIFK